MKVGDLTPMLACKVRYSDFATITYKAAKGRQYVFMLLGDESLDESDKLDPFAVLMRLGWKAPAKRIAKAKATGA